MIPVRTVFMLALLAGGCAGCAAQQVDATRSHTLDSQALTLRDQGGAVRPRLRAT
jgi:hypothetical protein